MSLRHALANYILVLEACLSATHTAEDRRIYEEYLSDAAGILALDVVGATSKILEQRIQSHERLWGHTWLQDEVYRKASAAWASVKEATDISAD